jgi:hypothetical protein
MLLYLLSVVGRWLNSGCQFHWSATLATRNANVVAVSEYLYLHVVHRKHNFYHFSFHGR